VTDILGAVAAAWGILMAVAPMLQVRRMIARRSSSDLSIAWLLVLEFGFLLWIAYGITLGNPFIFVPNTVAAIVGALTMFVGWSFRHGTPSSG
jgi:MtN3 and saliva related transmembrane protein